MWISVDCDYGELAVMYDTPPGPFVVQHLCVQGLGQKRGYVLCGLDTRFCIFLVERDKVLDVGVAAPLDAAQCRARYQNFESIILELEYRVLCIVVECGVRRFAVW
jgi:hypothetical protein